MRTTLSDGKTMTQNHNANITIYQQQFCLDCGICLKDKESMISKEKRSLEN